ncbi:hypothetical protein C8F01DRAFT_1253938 [Mycena amicta]|nr:hypothetical protein C8F01DRAFT_1253938 [Mycena amicta]
MIYSTRAVVPPNGFLPYGGRSVAVAPASSPPVTARRRLSVVDLIVEILPVLRTTKAEPLRRHRAYQGTPNTDDSPSYPSPSPSSSSSIVKRLSSLVVPKAKAEPLRRQAAQQGLNTYY